MFSSFNGPVYYYTIDYFISRMIFLRECLLFSLSFFCRNFLIFSRSITLEAPYTLYPMMIIGEVLTSNVVKPVHSSPLYAQNLKILNFVSREINVRNNTWLPAAISTFCWMAFRVSASYYYWLLCRQKRIGLLLLVMIRIIIRAAKNGGR